MATSAMIGHGTLFQTGDGNSPEAWVTVAEVSGIEPPSYGRDSVDKSAEQGPYEWREAIPGMKSPGDMKFKINFIPGGATFDDLAAEMDDEIIRSRRLVFPNGAVLPFSAFVKTIEPAAPTEGALTADITFQVSGRIGPFE